MKIRLAVFVAALVVLVSPSSTDAAPRSDDRFCYTCEVWAEDTEIWIPQLGRFAIRPYSASCEAYTGDNMAHGLWDTCETNPGSYTIVNGEVEFQIGCNGLQENELCNNDEGFLSLVDLAPDGSAAFREGGTSGNDLVRGCGGAIMERHYAPELAERLRQRSIVL